MKGNMRERSREGLDCIMAKLASRRPLFMGDSDVVYQPEAGHCGNSIEYAKGLKPVCTLRPAGACRAIWKSVTSEQ